MLDMDNPIHRICLYIIYQPRIQASLDRTISSWNLHRLRTEHHKSPVSIYELSREKAKTIGYWNSDPGDDLPTASDPHYGEEDGEIPPLDELHLDPDGPNYTAYNSKEEERQNGVFINDDDEVKEGRDFFTRTSFDWRRDDDNWGINVYCEGLTYLEQWINANSD